MATLAVKNFALDLLDWDLDGDAVMEGAVATLTDPRTTAGFGPRTWGWTPDPGDYDVDGNVTLPYDVELEMMSADIPYDVGDAEFFIWLWRLGDWESDDDTTFRIRLDTLTEDQMRVVLAGIDATTQATQVYAEDGGLHLDDRANLEQVFPTDEWRLLVVRSVGTVLWVEVRNDAGLLYKTAKSLYLDRTDTGTFGIYVGGASRIWKAGTEDSGIGNPGFAVPASGTIKLAAGQQWTLPLMFSSFERMTALRDFTHDPLAANIMDITLLYNLRTGGVWSGWTELDIYGDMSGISANAGDKLLVGAELTNESQFRTWPGLVSFNLTFYREAVSEVSTMREVAAAIKDDLDADGTISAFTGWDSDKGCIICYESQRDTIPLNTTAGVFICLGDSPLEEQGDGKSGDEVVIAGMTYRELAIYPTVQLATSNPSAVATSDDGLEALTEAVWAALKVNSFGGAIKWMELEGVQEDVGGGYRKDKVYTKVNRIGTRSFVGGELV